MKHTFFFILCVVGLIASARAQPAIDTLFASDLMVAPKFRSLFDSAHTVLLPRGFRCEVYYSSANFHPRSLAIGPDGGVACSDMNAGSIYSLSENSGTGVADTAITLAYNDGGAHGFAFYHNALYTSASTYVLKYEHQNASGLYTDSSVFIDSIPNGAEGADNHYTRTILFDTVGKNIFLSDGSPCNACREKDTDRATIFRYNLDGSGRSIYATGVRNAVGLSMDYQTNTLWAAVAERNNLGPDAPGDFATRILKNGFYGWPLAYGDHQWDDFSSTAEYQAMLPITRADSLKVAGMIPPDIVAPAHSTALGVAVYRGSMFPAQYHASVFVTLHGSYNSTDGRLIANGSKIIRGIPNDTGWTLADFATGFLTDSIRYQRWARPCGIVIDSIGDLYFCSDESGAHSAPAVYKIFYEKKFSVNSPVLPNLDALRIFPDPVSRESSTVEFRAELSSASSIGTLSISDITGREIGSYKLQQVGSSTYTVTLSTSELGAGVYFARVLTNSGMLSGQFVVMK
ncbi:MAG TPA: PQQ-dependent sugar dehydrogenase [Candidatus Kapabacteria bacterium]|nr:PQQ-dependent sugar dehydrogenase [Candidatus Kapabacteria bacterium]